MLEESKKRPIVAASAIIVDSNNSILLVKRKYPPGKDRWALPGGHVEYGESIEEAVIREIKEETGYTVKVKHFLFPCTVIKRKPRSNDFEYHFVILVFEAEIVSGQLTPGTDAEEAKFFSKEDAFSLNLTMSTRACLRQYFKTSMNANTFSDEILIIF